MPRGRLAVFRRRGFAHRAIRLQGCLLRVQKCTVGRSQEVSSKVPARTLRNGLVDLPLQIHEPHSGHTHRDSCARYRLCGALPVARRQMEGLRVHQHREGERAAGKKR